MLRLAQIGLGPLGRFIVADAASRRIATVVACVDTDPTLHDRRLADVVPACNSDVTIAPSLDGPPDAPIDWSAVDCAIVSTSSDLARCAPTLRDLLTRGVNIVSTCEELLFPRLRHAELADELHDLALRHNARLVGTGVNPGFMMDTLPVAMSAVCRNVRAVRVWRIQDASSRRIPFQKKIGAGLSDRAFHERIADGSLRHVGLGESLHFIAHHLGLAVSHWDESIEPIHADRDLACDLGPIPNGNAAGVRQVARGWNPEGDEIVTLDFRAAIGQSDPPPHDRLRIEAEPVIDATIAHGVHGDLATVSITLNAVRSLLAAPPGLHTMASIPPVRALA
ncbi:MAG: hypothetical protein KF768_11690 [Phycisphaeraceae bacterium]|nr:hypothetical protein [Phycisphaeraceae bacterium]